MEKVMIKKLPTNFGRLLGGEDFKNQCYLRTNLSFSVFFGTFSQKKTNIEQRRNHF